MASYHLLYFGLVFFFLYSSTITVSALDEANATLALNDLCTSMPGMPGCYLKKLCDSDPNSIVKPYCHPISIVGAVCKLDMPNMKGCAQYNAECANNQTCQTLYPPPNNFPTSATLARGIYSICNEMTMEGCGNCPRLNERSTYSDCDLLEVYSNLCAAMPGMSQCGAWISLCSSSPVKGTSLCNDGSNPATQIPSMIMYFHTGLVEYILFKSWVPRNMWQYWLSMFALFLLAIVFEIFQALHVILDMYLANSSKAQKSRSSATQAASTTTDTVSPTHSSSQISDTSQNHTNTSNFGTFPLINSQQQRKLQSKKSTNWNRIILKGILRMVHATFAYALMLVTMTYNVGLFFSVIVGLGVGNMLAASIIQAAELVFGANAPAADWELCC